MLAPEDALSTTEWGIPNWCCAKDYGDTQDWTVYRWRWEFTRRREDYRSDFDEVAKATYEKWVEVYSEPHWRNKITSGVLQIHEPGFNAETSVHQQNKYGMMLGNPRISEQESHIYAHANQIGRGPSIVEGRGELFSDEAVISIPDGCAAVTFDLDRPLGPQISGILPMLEHAQVARRGRKLQNRTHPKKWLSYLRVLDGRETGASWKTIFDTVLAAQKSNNLNPEQEARGMWERARHLMFNFPI